MKTGYFVIEADIRFNGSDSVVQLLGKDDLLLAEINTAHDADTDNSKDATYLQVRKFYKLINVSKPYERIKCQGDVLKATIRTATADEIKADCAVINLQDSTEGHKSLKLEGDVYIRGSLVVGKVEFNNQSGLEFTDISSEAERTYNFGGKGFVKIQNPLFLNVSESGGHRLFSADGKSHYVPSGWIELTWITNFGKPNFVK